MGFEPTTSSLPRKCSTPELGQLVDSLPVRAKGRGAGVSCQTLAPGVRSLERAMGFEPTTLCLEGRSSTTELRPRRWWAEQDSNLRRHSHLIYSQAPLATWVSARESSIFGGSARPAAFPGCMSALLQFHATRTRSGPRGGGCLRLFSRHRARFLLSAPGALRSSCKAGAGGENRTRNRRFTKPVLYH